MILPSLAVPSFRKTFVGEFKKLKRNVVFVIAFSSGFWLLGAIFFFYAASSGPITLVSTISIISPFATLLFAALITKRWPKILKEEIDSVTFSLKLISILLIIFGVYLIAV
jgi:drug/metabolite transporter (DMT)-like permease